MDSQERPYTLYLLVDPRDGRFRYIGKTKHQIATRLTQHVHLASKQLESGGFKDNTYRANWIRQVLAAGSRPQILEIHRYKTNFEACAAEVLFIRGFRSARDDLTNTTDGGDGGIVSRKPACSDSEALKAYMSGLTAREVAAKLKTCKKRVLRLVNAAEVLRVNCGRAVADDTGRVFKSVAEAGRHYDIAGTAISGAIRRSGKSAGHRFSFVQVAQ